MALTAGGLTQVMIFKVCGLWEDPGEPEDPQPAARPAAASSAMPAVPVRARRLRWRLAEILLGAGGRNMSEYYGWGNAYVKMLPATCYPSVTPRGGRPVLPEDRARRRPRYPATRRPGGGWPSKRAPFSPVS